MMVMEGEGSHDSVLRFRVRPMEKYVDFFDIHNIEKMLSTKNIIMCVLGICAVCILIVFLRAVFKSPFSYPHFAYDVDVSGKRNPQIDDLLDAFLNAGGFREIQECQRQIEQWKQESCRRIERSILRGYRKRQYLRALDDDRAFIFHFVRSQTRYKQRDYVKSSYRVNVRTNSFACSYQYIQRRYYDLGSIGFESTLRDYHSKNQRKLLTSQLRKRIMVRDNYTCQLCGKYMPDGVGLQIDHIVPIAKGGKTVASNLRVLCSRCNGSKSDRMPTYYPAKGASMYRKR